MTVKWQNEWIGMRVSKIHLFYVSKERKGQSVRPIQSWIILFNFLCNI